LKLFVFVLALLNLGKKRYNYALNMVYLGMKNVYVVCNVVCDPLFGKAQGSKECDKAKLTLEYIQFIQKCKERNNSAAKNRQNSNTALVSDTICTTRSHS